jgi:hypothetical protein
LIYSLILYFFAKPASTHFVRLSASRTGLTQTFSTDPLLGSVGIFYFFVNSSKLDLLFNSLFFRQACQHSLRSAVCFPNWTNPNLSNRPDARVCWDFLFLRKFKQA